MAIGIDIQRGEGRSSPSSSTDSTVATLTRVGTRSSAVLLREQTGRIGETTRNNEGLRVRIPEQTRQFTTETHEHLYNNLDGELGRLLNLQRNPTTRPLFDTIMSHPEYRTYKELFDRFTTTKEGSTRDMSSRSVDEAALQKFMNTDAGFEIGYELLVKKQQEMALNAAAYLESNLADQDPRTLEGQKTLIERGGPGREALRKVGHYLTRLNRVNDKVVTSVGTRTQGGKLAAGTAISIGVGTAGAIAGSLTVGGLPSILLGGAIGAGAVPALNALFSRGETIKVGQVTELLKAAHAADPAKREWSKLMYGIDTKDFEVDRNTQTVRVAAGIRAGRQEAGSIKDADLIQQTILRNDELIRQAQEEMGIPHRQQSSQDVGRLVPESGGRRHLGHRRQQDRVFEQELMQERWETKVDGRGRPIRIQNAAGGWDPNPNYDRTSRGAIAEYHEDQEIYNRVFARYVDRALADFIGNKKNNIDDMGQKIKGVEDNSGSSATIRRIDAEKSVLTNAAEIVSDNTKIFADIDTDLSTISAQEREVVTQRGKVTAVPGSAVPAGADVDTLLADVIIDTTRRPTTPGASPQYTIRIGNRRISSIAGQEEEEEDRHLTREAQIDRTMVGISRDSALEKEDEKHDRNKNRIEDAAQVVQDTLAAIAKAESDRDRAYSDLAGQTLELNNLEDATVAMQNNRRDIVAWGQPAVAAVPGGGGAAGTPAMPAIELGNDQLASQPIDVLLQRINEANARTGGTAGWPNTENGERERREMVLRAMAEARANVLNTAITSPSGAFTNALAAGPGGYGFTETELLTLSPVQIVDRTSSAATPLVFADATALKNEAEARFRARQRGIRAVDAQIETNSEDLDRQRTRANEADNTPNPELETIKRAKERYGAINTYIEDTDPAMLAAQLDTSPVPATTAYLPAEQTSGRSIAYINMQNWIFGHRERDSANEGTTFEGTSGRDAAFNRNSRYVTPDILRDRLIALFSERGIATGGIATFDQAAALLQTSISTSFISRTHLAEALSERLIYGDLRDRLDVL